MGGYGGYTFLGGYGGHTFPKDICSKVNVLVWLEFELAYCDSTVQHFNH